jgi:MBG domain (YGX type)/Bacterial Ig-like domain (group 3)
LASSTLIGGTASVPGTFLFTTPSITPAAGTAPQSVTFTPADTVNFNTVTGTVNVNVNKASLVVTANNASRTYGDANPGFSASYSGFVNGDTASVISGAPSLTTSATSLSAVGTYAISPGIGSLAASNYSFSFVNGSLTITPAPLTITANDQSKVYGQTVALTSTAFTSSGLKNGETIGTVNLNSAGSASTASVAGSPYVIVPSSATGGTFTASNYAIAYVSGLLTVNKDKPAVNVPNPGNQKGPGPIVISYSVSPTYAGVPTGTVQVTVSNASGTYACTGTLSGGSGSCSMTISTKGFYDVTVNYPGDANFASSSYFGGGVLHVN